MDVCLLIVGAFGLYDLKGNLYGLDVGVLLELCGFLLDVRCELLCCVEVEGLNLKFNSILLFLKG